MTTSRRKNLLNWLYYATPPLLLIYIFSLIGFTEIGRSIVAQGMGIIALAIAIKLLASLLRIIKYNIINKDRSFLENSKIYLNARTGSELSILGHFSPMLHSDNRNIKIFESLFIDRYLEIFSTFLIASIFCLALMNNHWILPIAALILCSATVSMIAIWFIPYSAVRHILKHTKRLLGFYEKLQRREKHSKPVLIKIFILSLIASALEFQIVVSIFASLGETVEFGIVAIIWAIGGLISNLMLVTLGPAEVTSIYLFNELAGTTTAAVASVIITTKAITAICLLAVYLSNIFASIATKKSSEIRA